MIAISSPPALPPMSEHEPVPSPPAPYDTLPREALRARRLAPGERLFRQGERSRGPCFVARGAVELESHDADGHRLLLHRAGAGTVFAEAALFAERYHCDALAPHGAEVVLLAREALLERFGADALFARALAESFAEEIRTLRRRLELVAIRGAETRVLEAVRDGLLGEDIRGFAEHVALSPEATYRALASLVRRGLLGRPARGRYELLVDAGSEGRGDRDRER